KAASFTKTSITSCSPCATARSPTPGNPAAAIPPTTALAASATAPSTEFRPGCPRPDTSARRGLSSRARPVQSLNTSQAIGERIMNLSGKVAVVTGSSAGIGAAVARNLSDAGARLVLTARREDRLKDMQASLPTESAILAADIGAPDTADRLLALARERFGRADILINNAGILSTNPIDLVDIELMAKMIQVNFEAVMRLSYTFGRAFKAQGEGAIINVS